MGIRYLKKHAALEGVVSVEDAEPLQSWLKNHPQGAVNLSKCQHVHASVLQVLLAVRPKITGDVGDPWLAGILGATVSQAQAA
jgi:hypothetical protein